MLAASRSLTALLGFILGAALATLMDPPIQTQARSGPYLRWLLLIEIAFLGTCAVIWGASPDPIQGARLCAVIPFFAVSMGIQGNGHTLPITRSLRKRSPSLAHITRLKVSASQYTDGSIGKVVRICS